jgi:16S rRNA (guanine527-N7)-methyltransferase
MRVLLPLISRHLADSGVALLHKGRKTAQEIAEARKDWSFDLEEWPSLTDPEGRLLRVQRISRVG